VKPFTVVASRRHSSPEQERLLAGLSASLGELELANIGSSLKFCLLAEGAADCYPRLAPTSQWDTAAAQGVLEGAGGEVLELSGAPFSYPARESLLNEFFLALPAKAAWREDCSSWPAPDLDLRLRQQARSPQGLHRLHFSGAARTAR
jgi:3'(2'), 5'-bisphosphate nucleotidase